MPDTPKPSLDEIPVADIVAAVRDAGPDVTGNWTKAYHTAALRAALDTLREHERVVAERNQAITEMKRAQAERDRMRLRYHAAVEQGVETEKERDAARAELAEARAEIERLNKWADGFSDAQLKERRLCEEQFKVLKGDLEQATALAEKGAAKYAKAVVERDAARAELAEARDEILRLQKDVLTASYDGARAERLRAPPPEGAMEVALKILPIGFMAEAIQLLLPTRLGDIENKLREDIAHALTAAREAGVQAGIARCAAIDSVDLEKVREAERQKCAAVVERVAIHMRSVGLEKPAALLFDEVALWRAGHLGPLAALDGGQR